MEAADIGKAIAAIQKADKFLDVRERLGEIVEGVETDEDRFLGKREATEYFKADSSFEPDRNKVIKVSDVIAAANLISAEFIVRTWPRFIKSKLKEYIIGKIAGAAAGKAAAILTLKAGAGPLVQIIQAIVSAFTVRTTQKIEAQEIEKAIRDGSAAHRKSLNDLQLSQEKKPSRVGPTYTRNG